MADFSLPSDFLSRIRDQFGDQSDNFISALDDSNSYSVRINPLKVKPQLEFGLKIPWCDDGFDIKTRPVYTLDPLFHSGSYYPQESSSMFIHYLLNHIVEPTDDLKALDLCGAPGGKSTLLASFMNNKGLLVANEVIRSRSLILKENLIKWGYHNVIVSQSDPKCFGLIKSFFDVVLVDAPCSGEGMFRKDQAARNEWSVENANMCSLRQRRIISDIWPSIKEGGYLIYSTCTFNPEENENNIKWFLNQFDAIIVNVDIPESWPIQKIVINEGIGFGFYPHLTSGEGFFVVVIQKCGSERKVRYQNNQKSFVSFKNIPLGLIKNQEHFYFFQHKDHVIAILKNISDSVFYMLSNLNIIYWGIEIGKAVRKDFIPSHSAAMSTVIGDYYCKTELSLVEALKFLKGETNLNVDVLKDWMIVSYKNQPLGFVKGVGNRINNYYPKDYRIRMRID
ncbi:MAG: RNA methyltransferase [Marinilabiliaceae bacterium]|nr:RNA methyltransferase [Marinilabiliaceae bacterium]